MGKFIILLITTIPLLAFQCDDDFDDLQIANEFRVNVTTNSNLTTQDTIWVSARVSAKVFDVGLNDSVLSEYGFSDHISLMRLKKQDGNGNSIGAIKDFNLIGELNQASYSAFCNTSDLDPNTKLFEDGEFYEYRIGLNPLTSGDYVLKWNSKSEIINTNKNVDILDSYPIDGLDNALEMNRCGSISVSLNVDISKREYFFSVK